jgi:hypothetical protein
MPRMRRLAGEPEPPKPVVLVRRRPEAELGWAGERTARLEWQAAGSMHVRGADWGGQWLMATTRHAKWSVQVLPFETKAWVEPREPGRPRYEIGSFATVDAAQGRDAVEPEPRPDWRRQRRPVSLAKRAG